MNMIIRLFWVIVRIFFDILFLFNNNKLFVYSCLEVEKNNYKNKNWGDDINVYFLEYITNLKVKVINTSYVFPILNLKGYSCIGSILGLYNSPKLEVWGSGFIDKNINCKIRPEKVYSVRGKLSRLLLLNQGIPCPEKYGDPALLMSYFYHPEIDKRYDIGIVLHYVDNSNALIEDIVKKYPSTLIIRTSDYDNWKDIPNKICSCKRILSSSLHGLIISDSYNIPNSWIKLSDNITGGDFKFLDYFSSVGREEKAPTNINSLNDYSNLICSDHFYSARTINFQEIIDACPFKEHLKI